MLIQYLNTSSVVDLKQWQFDNYQYQAFQEAFEQFDKTGGGTIDAADLQNTLDDCGIFVDGDDLMEIMKILDHDGNGEVRLSLS